MTKMISLLGWYYLKCKICEHECWFYVGVTERTKYRRKNDGLTRAALKGQNVKGLLGCYLKCKHER